MPFDEFSELPADSRVWVFPLSKPLEVDSISAANEAIAEFTAGWKAHGKAVGGVGSVLYRRFVVIAADPSVSEVSGCSIDSMFRSVREIAQSVGADLADFSEVFYRRGDAIEGLPRATFKQLKRDGQVNAETIVFDNSVGSLAVLRNGGWERPMKESWHHQL